MALGTAHLTEQGQSGLNTNEETLDAERLEHDLSNLLSVLWWVHWRLGQDEPVLLWLAAQIRVHGLVPELFNTFPILNLSGLENVAQLVGLRIGNGLVADVVIKIWVVKFA